MKKIIISLIAVIFITVAIGSHYFSKSQKYSGPIEKIRIGNVGEYTIFNLIAKEKEYFLDNGLDATITEYTSGPASLTGLFNGETDVNIAADFVGVRNIFDHPDLRILAQVNQHWVFQLVAKKERINSPADLRGKKIGVTRNSAGEYFLGNFLNANNLKLEDITMVNLTPPEMITQVQDGTIDAMVVFEPHVYKLKKILGQNFVSWDVQGNRPLSALLYTTQPYLEKNEELLERYLLSLVQAEKYYLANVQEVKEFVAKKLGYDMEYVEYSWPKFKHGITLNQDLLVNMENEARWVIRNHLTNEMKIPNYAKLIYFDALQSVKPKSINIAR